MPLYEYYCSHCDSPFEALRSMSEADRPIACPQCATTTQRRVISLFAAVSKDSAGGSRLVASSQSGGGCASCGGGHCASCGH